MADTGSSESKIKPRGKGLMVKLLLGLGLLMVGGAAAYGMIAAGLFGSGAHTGDDNQPRLIRKGEQDPFAPVAAEGEENHGGAEHHGDGGSEFRTLYFSFHEAFTTNLKDSDALLQVSIACSTRRDGRVIAWLKDHELAIRSELLNVLADTPEDELSAPGGKQRLQHRLTAAINKVLVAHEGFGGIDAVYFISMIVQ